jgi:rhodanese-related sulfurtransferase
MNRTFRSFIFLLTLLALSCGERAQGQILDNPEQFQSFIDKNEKAQIVDVRTPDEFKQGYIAGAVNLNFYDSDFKEKLKTLDKSKPVLVYCAVGGRSGQASKILQELGFENVHDLDGGMTAWNKKGLPVKN